MDKKQICRQLRHEFGKIGLALLIYYGIMNVTVILATVVESILYVFGALSSGADMDALAGEIVSRVVSNGWGYILASFIGFVAILIWKKPHFCFVEIWKTDRPMRPGGFAALLCIFISGQALFQLGAAAMEWFFNLFDMSIMDALESASMTGDTLSMFLYITLVAPVFEEILFRGLILRSFTAYGKKFAIFASAFLFGMFHGNLVQTPYAFVVGLVLGYVAVEYSIGWAMVLHMINNLVLGDSIARMTRYLPPWVQELVFFVLIWGCTLAAVIILIRKRRSVMAYFRQGRIHPWCLRSFFASPAVITLNCILGVNILLTVLLQLIV